MELTTKFGVLGVRNGTPTFGHALQSIDNREAASLSKLGWNGCCITGCTRAAEMEASWNWTSSKHRLAMTSKRYVCPDHGAAFRAGWVDRPATETDTSAWESVVAAVLAPAAPDRLLPVL